MSDQAAGRGSRTWHPLSRSSGYFCPWMIVNIRGVLYLAQFDDYRSTWFTSHADNGSHNLSKLDASCWETTLANGGFLGSLSSRITPEISQRRTRKLSTWIVRSKCNKLCKCSQLTTRSTLSGQWIGTII